jgi:glycosyltransferase involved in cell wall biosynthesis
MPFLYSSAFNGQAFYREDLDALSRSFAGTDCSISSSFSASLAGDYVLAYFYTYSSLLSLLRAILLKPTVLTGGADFLSDRPSTVRYYLLLILFYAGVFSCKALLAVSDYDYCLIRSYLPSFLKKKVVLSPHSLAMAFHIASDDSDLRNPVSMDGLTVCWQGSSKNPFRKGVDRAIRLYNSLHLKGVFARLTIAGALGPGTSFIRDVIQGCIRPDLFILTDYVAEHDLKSLFLSNSYYIQLSRMEGFGLSVAEAVLYGCKIICTDSGGLTTSSGPCALYVDSSTLQLIDNGSCLDPLPLFTSARTPSRFQRLEFACLLSTDRRAADIKRSFSFPS